MMKDAEKKVDVDISLDCLDIVSLFFSVFSVFVWSFFTTIFYHSVFFYYFKHCIFLFYFLSLCIFPSLNDSFKHLFCDKNGHLTTKQTTEKGDKDILCVYGSNLLSHNLISAKHCEKNREKLSFLNAEILSESGFFLQFFALNAIVSTFK